MVDQKVNACEISRHIVGLPSVSVQDFPFLSVLWSHFTSLPSTPHKKIEQIFGFLSKTLLESIHVRTTITRFGSSLGCCVRMFSGCGNSLWQSLMTSYWLGQRQKGILMRVGVGEASTGREWFEGVSRGRNVTLLSICHKLQASVWVKALSFWGTPAR